MKLIVFDMDGTLIDSAGFIVQTLHDSFVSFGLEPPSDAEARHIIGLSLHNALQSLTGIEGVELDRLVETYRATYRARLGDERYEEPLFYGARDVLAQLQARDDVLLAIATGKGLSGVNRILDIHGMGDWFVSKQTPDHNPSKPHPGMLYRAMDEVGVGAEQTIMIGDTSYDMEMARAANTHALGVTWGSHDVSTLTRTGAQRIIGTYADMPKAIFEMLDMDMAG